MAGRRPSTVGRRGGGWPAIALGVACAPIRDPAPPVAEAVEFDTAPPPSADACPPEQGARWTGQDGVEEDVSAHFTSGVDGYFAPTSAGTLRLGPGAFTTTIDFRQVPEGRTVVVGCGVEQTHVYGHSDPLLGAAIEPGPSLEASHLSLVSDGSTAHAPISFRTGAVHLHHARIVDARRNGVIAAPGLAEVRIEDTEIIDATGSNSFTTWDGPGSLTLRRVRLVGARHGYAPVRCLGGRLLLEEVLFSDIVARTEAGLLYAEGNCEATVRDSELAGVRTGGAGAVLAVSGAVRLENVALSGLDIDEGAAVIVQDGGTVSCVDVDFPDTGHPPFRDESGDHLECPAP